MTEPSTPVALERAVAEQYNPCSRPPQCHPFLGRNSGGRSEGSAFLSFPGPASPKRRPPTAVLLTKAGRPPLFSGEMYPLALRKASAYERPPGSKRTATATVAGSTLLGATGHPGPGSSLPPCLGPLLFLPASPPQPNPGFPEEPQQAIRPQQAYSLPAALRPPVSLRPDRGLLPTPGTSSDPPYRVAPPQMQTRPDPSAPTSLRCPKDTSRTGGNSHPGRDPSFHSGGVRPNTGPPLSRVALLEEYALAHPSSDP
ncbi:proline-rich protein 2-like [Odontomachus brunneus]|uniref:proline-rich protein 2-like n=1 Tax=Odontomachus brunneus TaxID=486640 RepID=UPI0013F1837B|nr:proline-rich protein 2-like [Odontomachus brunneus]